ncbi:MlaD family protein [Pseudonocardia sp. RS010]|uniref:MlaD family protein n=1 Tax=Pseudonocardia sp. RS010 TaxID=3385979 RepID=UPI0039A37F10
MSTARFRPAALLVALGLAVTATTAAATAPDSDETVTAVFTDASPLVPGNEVRTAGVTVGEVDSVELQDGVARVTMTLRSSVLPLHTDAHATITDKDLLGERYVKLERGTPSAPTMDDPVVIPKEQTGRVVDLQEVLNAADDPTATALAALVTTFGEGVEGQGVATADVISALAPAMRQTDELGSLLSDQNELLSRLVGNVQPVAGALAADRGGKLDRLVGSAESSLSAVAADRQAVEDSLRRLPGTLADARRTLSQVAGVSDATTPTLAGIRPTTDDLQTISTEITAFADAADPALASLPPVLDRAKAMLDEARPFVDDLAPSGPDLESITRGYRPLSDEALTGPHLTDLMEFLKGWALSTTGYDAIGHYFRASVPATPKALGQIAGGAVPGAPVAPVPDLPLPQPDNLPLPGHGPIPPEGPTSPNDNHAAPPADGTDSATGLTGRQETDMLGQLLGGR